MHAKYEVRSCNRFGANAPKCRSNVTLTTPLFGTFLKGRVMSVNMFAKYEVHNFNCVEAISI